MVDRNNLEGQGDSLITVRRTMLVLEMLADAQDGLSLSDIARELSVNKSIALRITSTLDVMQYIYRHPNKKFYASYKICNVGLRILWRAKLLDQCQPVLRRLAEETGELVLLSVMDQGQPRWVMSLVGVRRRLQVEPMTSLEPHSTATGKAWLATLPNAAVAKLLKGRMPALTPFTITDLDRMKVELAEIRTTGISFSNQEDEIGIAAVATAIRVQSAKGPSCVGFVSITAPLARASTSDFDRYRQLVVEAAQTLGDAWPILETADFSQGMHLDHNLLTV